MVQNQYPCDVVVPIEQEPRHRLVFANDFVRFFMVEIAPHDQTLCHHHGHDYLMYVAGDAQIVSAPRDGEPTTHTYRDGDCEFSPAGLVHAVENLRETKFRNLLVELLPGVHKLRRGPDPRVLREDVKSINRFDGPQISVFLLELEVGSQAEISGPAILASAYDHDVELAVAKEGTRASPHFRDLLWLGPATTGTLGNHCDTVAKVVLIALGRT